MSSTTVEVTSSHDASPKVEASSSREALLSVWEQRCWEFIPCSRAVAQVSSCRFVRPSWTGITASQLFFSFLSPPQDSLRALQRLKTRQNAATCFWWVFHLLLSSLSNPSQTSKAPPDRISSLGFHRPAELSAGTCAAAYYRVFKWQLIAISRSWGSRKKTSPLKWVQHYRYIHLKTRV